MGNSGVYGFRINEQDKVTYNQWDSYPNWLGRNVMQYIASTPIGKMQQVASSIILIDEASTPSQELIEKYRHYADLNVSNQKYEDWYCLLRNAQGELFPYNRDLLHMIDGSAFLSNSLACRWAYIINLDNEKLEVYRGLNRDDNAKGRYAGKSLENNYGYQGVALKKEIALKHIKKEILDDLVAELNELAYASH